MGAYPPVYVVHGIPVAHEAAEAAVPFVAERLAACGARDHLVQVHHGPSLAGNGPGGPRVLAPGRPCKGKRVGLVHFPVEGTPHHSGFLLLLLLNSDNLKASWHLSEQQRDYYYYYY